MKGLSSIIWGEKIHFIGGSGKIPSEIAILRTLAQGRGKEATGAQIGCSPLPPANATAFGALTSRINGLWLYARGEKTTKKLLKEG